MAHLYADYYQKRFRVSCCSGVALVWLAFLFLSLAIPYYLCYVTQGNTLHLTITNTHIGFWTKQVEYVEHADVDF